MSQKEPSQDSNSEDIEWDIEELKDSIKRSAEQQWDDLLDSAGQHLVPGSAALIWEMEKKKAKELDMELQRDYNKKVEGDGHQQGVTE
tara:strand:- start:3465 stop:3728 length:264 start_codon:yes stop_codon:yes gene_type:complete